SIPTRRCRKADASGEIAGERLANRLGHHRHMAVIRMVEADDDRGAGLLETRLRRGIEGKADELHRGGLALRRGVLARRIGQPWHLPAIDGDRKTVLDPAEPRQLA